MKRLETSILLVLLIVSLVTNAQKPELVVPIGHTNWVKSVAFSPNGRYAISCGDNILKLWEVSTGKLLSNFGRHESWVNFVTFSPDGQYVISLNHNNAYSFRLWEIKSGKLVRSFDSKIVPVKGVNRGYARSISFSPDGRYVLSGHDDNTLKMWKVRTGKLLKVFKSHTDWVMSVAVSPDGNFALSGSADSTLKLWDINTGKALKTFHGHRDWIRSVAFSPDGRTALSGSWDQTTKLWDISGSKLLRSFDDHSGRVHSVAFSPNGQYIVSGCGWAGISSFRDGTINLREVSTGNLVHQFVGSGDINSVVFSPDSRYILSGSDDAKAQLWDVVSHKFIRSFTGHGKEISQGVYFNNSPFFLLGTGDNTIHIWDMSVGHPIRRLIGRPQQAKKGYSGDVNEIKISPDDRHLLSISFGVVTVWDVNAGKKLHQLEGVSATAFSSDSLFGLTAYTDGTFKLWNLYTKKLIREFKGSVDKIRKVKFSPDGLFIACFDETGFITLLDTKSGELLSNWKPHIQKAHIQYVDDLEFSPNSRFVIIGNGLENDPKKRLTLWEISTGKFVRYFTDHPTLENLKTLINFSPDNLLALSNDNDANLDIWNIKNGKRLHKLKGHSEDLNSATFSPDGQFILSCSADHTSKVWNTSTGKEIATLIALDSNDWVVTTTSGLFDASPGAMKLMHYVVNDPIDKDEPWQVIELNQLKQRYYQPGLLAILMGYKKDDLRQVPAFESVTLPPAIQLSLQRDTLMVQLTNRKGGIGPVSVFINGAEMVEDLRSNSKRDSTQKTLSLVLPLASFTSHFYTNAPNVIRVVAQNGEGWLRSRPVEINYQMPRVARGGEPENPSASSPRQIPRFRAVVAGTSTIGLRFAHSDAEQMANGLRLAANELFSPANVTVQLLVTKPGSPAQTTKANLVKALEAAQQTRAEDIFVLHISGHAVNYGNYGGQDGDLYFLLAGATSTDVSYLNDKAIRETYTLSSKELIGYLKKISANKKVLILDVCSAGKGAKQILAAARDVPGSQIRALDRLQERMGLYVLAGSAADAVSYEANVYGHGLVTYALLRGMKGEALRKDGTEFFLNVDTWLRHAVDQVPVMAKGVGGIQQPFYWPISQAETANPGRATEGSFDIGRVTEEVKTQIHINEPKPVLLVKSFQEETQFDDVLELKNKVESALNDLIATRGADVPLLTMEATDYPGAFALSGRYTLQGESISVACKVFRFSKPVGEFVVAGTKSKLPDLVQLVLTKANLFVCYWSNFNHISFHFKSCPQSSGCGHDLFIGQASGVKKFFWAGCYILVPIRNNLL